MDKQLTQLISIIITFSYLLFASGSYEVLNLPKDARSLALNNTTSAYGGPLLRNNPASLSMHSTGITYSYLYLPANIHSGEIHRIIKTARGIKASKISLLSYGAIIDSETEEKSYAFDVLLEMGFKRELKNIISVGISGGYLFSSVTGFNSQLLFSKIGVRNRLLKKRFGVGFSLENVGIILKSYTDIKESIPTLFRTSFYYKPMYIPLIINWDIVKKLDSKSLYFSSGFEFMYQNRLTFRLGISSKRKSYLTEDFSSDFIAGISGGVGFRVQKKTLDIGFMNLGPAGFIIGFSIRKDQN